MARTKHPALFEFGRRVRALRQERGVSQEELAGLAGVHRTYIGMIERGEKNITLINIIRIAKALGCAAVELIPDECPPSASPTQAPTSRRS